MSWTWIGIYASGTALGVEFHYLGYLTGQAFKRRKERKAEAFRAAAEAVRKRIEEEDRLAAEVRAANQRIRELRELLRQSKIAVYSGDHRRLWELRRIADDYQQVEIIHRYKGW